MTAVTAPVPLELLLFERAQRDLAAIPHVERRQVIAEIDRLALDSLQRGVETLRGRFRDHMRLRVGRFRLLYRVADGVLTIVAITSDR